MEFVETRGNDGKKPERVAFSEAILSPSASYGGLYVPERLPSMDTAFLSRHLESHYKQLALDLLDAFGLDIDPGVVTEALQRYDGFDDPSDPVPVVPIEKDCTVAELYHGQTRAFKDMALQPFGYILSHLARQRGEHYLIMAATSGDTGPATLETFQNEPNVKVTCLYPYGGTSDVQRLQMVTEAAENLKVIGVKGNFDDTQQTLKSLLASEDFVTELQRRDIHLSAANSVNFGRIIFQIIYHVHAYLALIRQGRIVMGEEIYLVVPSGNFGNALGAYYAKKAGLPIRKILIASNINNILTEWIATGTYDLRNRELILTQSPAMDILKSSNIERVLYDKFGPQRTRELFDALQKDQYFTLSPEELAMLQEDFDATFSSDAEGEQVISQYAKRGYLMDPHTATCIKAYHELRETPLQTVIYATAEWTKFSSTVARALGFEPLDDAEALAWVGEQMNTSITHRVAGLFDKPIRHQTIVEKCEIREEILAFL
jgi:threonine synthase